MNNYLIKILIFSILGLFPVVMLSQSAEKLKVEKGQLTISGWDFEEDEELDLSGYWEFYWMKLYTPADFHGERKADAYVKVPGSWSKSIENNPDTGYATLRLIIYSDSSYNNLSLVIKKVLTSYTIFVNKRQLYTTGNILVDSNQIARKYHREIISLSRGKNEIIVQISNYVNTHSGFVDAPVIGNSEMLTHDILIGIFSDLFIFSLLVVMSLFNFALFFNKKDFYSALFFAIMLLVGAIYLSIYGNFIMSYFFTAIPLKLIYIISFSTFYAFVPLLCWYVKELLEIKKHKWFFVSITIISFIFMLTIFLPTYYVAKFSLLYQIVCICVLLFLIFLFVKYVKLKRYGAKSLLISSVFLLISMVVDMLSFNEVIFFPKIFPYGLLVLVIFQFISLIFFFSFKNRANIKKSKSLIYKNNNLQKIVDKRTRVIKESTDKLENQNHVLEQVNSKLKIFYTVMEQNPLFIIIVNPNLEIEYMNPAFYSSQLNNNKNIYNQTTSVLNFGENTERTYIADWGELTIDNGGKWQGQFVQRQNTGEVLYNYLITISAIKDKENNIVNYLAIIEDATELYLKDKDLESKNNQLSDLIDQLETAHSDIVNSIGYARILLSALQPNHQVLSDLFDDYFLIYTPSEQIGGIYYYANKIGRKRIFSISDNMNKGVFGATISVFISSLGQQLLTQNNVQSISELFILMRKQLSKLQKNLWSVYLNNYEIAFCVYDEETKFLHFLGVDLPLLVYQDNELTVYKSENNRFIDEEQFNYEEKIIKIKKETKLIMVSRGLFNLHNKDNSLKFGEKRFINLIERTSYLDCAKQKERIDEKLNDWLRDSVQTEDVVVLGLKIES